MAVVSIKNKLRRGNLLVGNDPYIPPILAFDSIATTTVGSGGASSITFSSIPSDYTHLQIRMMARFTNDPGGSTDDWFIWLRPNNDSSSSVYTFHDVGGRGSGGSSYGVGTGGGHTGFLLNRFPTNIALSNTFGVNITDILDYRNTNKYKTFRAIGGNSMNFNNSKNGVFSLHSGLWLNTNAITSFTLVPGFSSNFAQYSHFALYGIKAF
jgi:hypothetical protein